MDKVAAPFHKPILLPPDVLRHLIYLQEVERLFKRIPRAEEICVVHGAKSER